MEISGVRAGAREPGTLLSAAKGVHPDAGIPANQQFVSHLEPGTRRHGTPAGLRLRTVERLSGR